MFPIGIRIIHRNLQKTGYSQGEAVIEPSCRYYVKKAILWALYNRKWPNGRYETI